MKTHPTFKTQLTVIVNEQGMVIATHTPNRAHINGNIFVKSGLDALPGQIKYEFEFEVPESFSHQSEIDQYHQKIQAHIDTHIAGDRKTRNT